MLEVFPQHLQDYVRDVCPFQIDDKIVYELFYNEDYISLKGIVKDITPHLKGETMEYSEENKVEYMQPIPKFSLELVCDVPERKRWFEFFKKTKYIKWTLYATINQYGEACESSSIFKSIRKYE